MGLANRQPGSLTNSEGPPSNLRFWRLGLNNKSSFQDRKDSAVRVSDTETLTDFVPFFVTTAKLI
jgi:hypothetical protein